MFLHLALVLEGCSGHSVIQLAVGSPMRLRVFVDEESHGYGLVHPPLGWCSTLMGR